MLAHSEGMEPQNFLQLAHGQPFLWQWGFSTYQWSPPPRLPCAAIPIRCRSVFRTTTVIPIGFASECRSPSLRNRDRHHFGTLIAIPRNPQVGQHAWKSILTVLRRHSILIGY